MKYLCIYRLVLRCLLIGRKKNLTGVSTGLTGRSKNLDQTSRFPPLVRTPNSTFNEFFSVLCRLGNESTVFYIKKKNLSRPKVGL